MLTRILLAGLLASTMMFAQRGGGGGGSKGGGGNNVPSIGFGGPSRLDRMADQLKFTKDQKRDVKAAMDEAQKEAAPIHEQMNKSRLAIAEAIAAAKPKEEIDKAVMSEAALETQMTELELQTLFKCVALLEPEQKKQGVQILFVVTKGAFLGKNWNSD